MLQAIEKAIIEGSGEGQPLGITKYIIFRQTKLLSLHQIILELRLNGRL